MIDPETEGHRVAVRFRADHGLGDQPLGDLITIIEQTTVWMSRCSTCTPPSTGW